MSLTWGNVKPPRGARVDWSHPLSRNLAGLWLFNEGAGGRVNDLASGNTGVWQGTPGWGPGKAGGGGVFNGTNNAVKAVATRLPVTAWSLAAWVKPATIPTTGSDVSMALYVGNDSAGYGFAIGQVGGNAPGSTLVALFGGKFWVNSSYASFVAGNWTHVVMTLSGLSVTFYVNGKVVTVASVGSPPAAPAAFVTTGAELSTGNAPTRLFAGGIDEPTVWSRALTPNDVSKLSARPYQMIAPVIPDTIYYSFGSQVRFRRTVLTGGMADYTGRIHG